MIIYTPDTLRAQVEAATDGRVTVLYDDTGAPSYMHVIPKFRYEDLGLDGVLGTGVATAFSVGGVEKSEIFIGQYLASVYDGRAVSLPGRTPQTMISFLDAKASCVNKGAGWHLMTAHEWAAIALWCKVNGHIPRGNTLQGKAYDAPHEAGYQTLPEIISNSTATGSGPASWRHNGSITGIADLVGNVSEWNDLLKTVGGQFFTTQDNDFTTNVLEGLDHYITIHNESVSLQNTPAASDGMLNVPTAWTAVVKASNYTESQLLQRLLISPTPPTALAGGFYALNNTDEFYTARGGFFLAHRYAGLAAIELDRLGGPSPITGFRPAFVL